ncbi:WD40 repeat-like protein [Coniochaeta ligniaria NRRL 30616]|uniref:WD40 repeat-like protein n=1 Tax=Coniochaeta ligniaria NRRL 30616 TaxID=1408157 RepID=A0A1J7IXK4_9PEZI|nr:WD40 repeat-like protein [Coniochaeta ligniaria NRRL 30616]
MAFYSPTPDRSRLKRQAFSSPTCLGLTTSDLTPADSGYGSTFVSPDRWEAERQLWDIPDRNSSLLELLDGTRSPDATFNTPRVKESLPRRPRSASATLPRHPGRSRPTLPACFFSESNLRTEDRQSETPPRRPQSGSLRVPDRFIPLRDTATPVGDIFRITKGVSQLNTAEKLLRNNSAASDAFVYQRRLVSPMASDYRLISRSDTGAVRSRVGTVLAPLQPSRLSSLNVNIPTERQVSYGSVWTVGGVAPSGNAVNSGRGHLIQTGTSARLFRTTFSTAKPKRDEELEKHEARLATALELDQTQRVLEFDNKARSTNPQKRGRAFTFTPRKTFWDGAQWVNEGPTPATPKPPENRALPVAPFKVLDAPNLKDDFYCSLLAYSPNCHTLVVGLGNLLYAWSERNGVRLLNGGTRDGAWLTSVAFSSTQGCKAILAYGRSNCVLSLMSLYDSRAAVDDRFPQGPILPRFEVRHPAPISCVRWRPAYTIRRSGNPHSSHRRTLAKMEDLLVSDEVGTVYYYSVEWPERWELDRNNWPGEMVLMAIIKVHSQQICGLSWSPSGDLFATGGNDNLCSLFETSKVTSRWDRAVRATARRQTQLSQTTTTENLTPQQLIPQAVELKPGDEKQRWPHAAAVKAIAFCPWQDGLVATGGGSNDKCIHFFHTCSGAALATISVSAQVTSLIWSNTRREIVATFGYAEPEHPYRIAIFSWPDCRQVGAIPWEGGHRALYAIPYPSGARDVDRRARNRASAEGCIVVAASDNSVKFHEVWVQDSKSAAGGIGMLGGSEILEDLQGIEREGDVIR